MTCPACLAAQHELSHLFLANCQGCDARALSRSRPFAESRKAQALTDEYRDALGKLEITHEQVKAAHDTDFINRRESATIEREA
jgi:hypothetical protein